MNLWFTTSVGTNAGVPAHVPDMFCFGCSTNGVSLISLSSSLLPVLLASDSISGLSCSLDSSWYSNCSSRSSVSCALIICSAVIFVIY